MDQSLRFDPDLIKRYDKSGPRYTSYPTALELHDGFTEKDYRQHIVESNVLGGPLSLYVHVPFCDTVCFYCACNKIITNNRKHAEPYVDSLLHEIKLQGALFDSSRIVNQLHFGGGTPTFLNNSQMRAIMSALRQAFTLRDDDQGEYSIEVDPRETREDTVSQLRDLGFNRISLGVQDFDERVQKAVNRLQTEEQTFRVLDSARELGFRSTNIDLIYGLPLQSLQGFATTLDKLLSVKPDRFSIFNYAHLPTRFKPQRQINEADLPSPELKLDILQMIGQKLIEAGYVYIGMDHFAKPDDELAVAQREGKLYRNFQGYSTHSDCDLIGLGMTSIGRVHDAYIQNTKELADYNDRLAKGQIPVIKGLSLTFDDKVRRAVISQLICHFDLQFSQIEQEFGIIFNDYFKEELPELLPMQADGLLSLSERRLEVQAPGRLLIRNICMAFDNYLHQKRTQQFSKVI